MTSNDLYTVDRSSLEAFIANNIQADAQFLRCCGEVIDDLVRRLQMASQILRPRRIIKSGSLGKGTAIKGRSDIDLIIMLSDYTDVDVLMLKLKGLLENLERYLVTSTSVKHMKTTRYSVQVEVTCRSGHQHDVDILPAVDLLELGNSLTYIYTKMAKVSADTMHEYSATLSPLQLEIISNLHPKVKNLIKLIKYWKDTKLKSKREPNISSFAERQAGRTNWPTSYVLELVVISAWCEARAGPSFDMTRALHAVLTSLVNHRQFKIVLDRFKKYDNNMLKPRRTPYIMDPANPYNDMYHGLPRGDAFDWDDVVPEARIWLSKPLFAGVENTKHSW